MAWFSLGDQEKRNKRKGIWLRVNSCSNTDIIDKIKETKLMRKGDTINYIEICELRENNKVLLKITCSNIFDTIKGKIRYNVFFIQMEENLDWTCEADLGKGLK
jgi:hypothetical protein